MSKGIPGAVRLLFILLVFLFSYSAAQVIVDLDKVSQKPGFYVDLASFYDPATKETRLEVYYKIHNHQLSFLKTEDDYLASYEVRVLLMKKGRQIAGTSREEKYPVSSYAQTISPDDYIINQLSLEVDPGKYEAQVTLIDKNAQKGYTLKLAITVREYESEELALSDIEFAEETSDTLAGSHFNKKKVRVVPKVKQTMSTTLDSLKFYFEIYSQKFQPLQVDYVTKTFLGRIIQSKSEKMTLESNPQPLVRAIDISNLPPGRYTLSVLIPGQGRKPRAEVKQDFEVDWSIEYYVRHDFQEAVDFLRYITNSEETKTLKKATPEKQLQAWRDFWKSKDPTPDTPENEVEEEYYRRVRYANDNYGSWSKQGWKTDFGMVYIKYGQPDEIDRHPYDRGSSSYEVWYYYSLRKVFTFLEVGQEYRLQYPYDGNVYRFR